MPWVHKNYHKTYMGPSTWVLQYLHFTLILFDSNWNTCTYHITQNFDGGNIDGLASFRSLTGKIVESIAGKVIREGVDWVIKDLSS